MTINSLYANINIHNPKNKKMYNTYPSSPFNQEASLSAERPATSERTIDGFTIKTNLPEDLSVFDSTHTSEHLFERPLLPNAVDAIAAGQYIVESPYSDDDPRYDRSIIVSEDENGKYVIGMETGLFDNIDGSQKLMQALGYKLGYDTKVPTPNTLQKNARKLGVEIEYFSDQGLIESQDYLRAFAEGKYPVSTGTAKYYTHDTQDDHLTAMVLGGETLRSALQAVAAEALAEGMELDEYANAIDMFTADLRGAVAPTFNDRHKRFDHELRYVGRGLGLDETTIDMILEAAKAKGREFGMDVRE